MLARFGIHICKRTLTSFKCVQKFALRMCAKQWDLGYAELLNRFKVPSLRDRRNYLSLCTMYKVVHELVYFDLGNTLNHDLADKLDIQAKLTSFLQKANGVLFRFSFADVTTKIILLVSLWLRPLETGLCCSKFIQCRFSQCD